MAPNLEMRLYSGYPLCLKQPAGNHRAGTPKTVQAVPVVLKPAFPASRDNDHACNRRLAWRIPSQAFDPSALLNLISRLRSGDGVFGHLNLYLIGDFQDECLLFNACDCTVNP